MGSHRNRELRKGSSQIFRDVWKTSPHFYVNSLGQAIRYSQVSDLFKFQWLERIFPQGPQIRSLECGCGAAGASAYFAERGYNPTMLDLTETALVKAQESFQRYKLQGTFVLGDVLQMPFADSTFDVIMSFGLLEHFSEPEQPIREMIRLLKPSGLFFADIVPKKFSVQTLANFFVNGLAVAVYYTLHGQPWYGLRKGLRKAVSLEDFYESTYPIERYQQALVDGGLGRIRWVGATRFPDIYFPFWLMPRWVRWLKGRREAWLAFGKSNGRFASRFWCRSYWLWGQKPPLREDAATL